MTQKQQDMEFVEISQAFNAKIQAKIKTSLSARYFPKNYEVNTLPSKTVPDQSMPLKTILERFARGLPINAPVNNPIWDNDPKNQGIDLRKLDLAEKEVLLDEARETIGNHHKGYKQAQEPGTPTTKGEEGPLE